MSGVLYHETAPDGKLFRTDEEFQEHLKKPDWYEAPWLVPGYGKKSDTQEAAVETKPVEKAASSPVVQEKVPAWKKALEAKKKKMETRKAIEAVKSKATQK